MGFGSNFDFLCRKKSALSVQTEETKLARVLSIFDLTMLGIFHCKFMSVV
jgi:hypothetical protein